MPSDEPQVEHQQHIALCENFLEAYQRAGVIRQREIRRLVAYLQFPHAILPDSSDYYKVVTILYLSKSRHTTGLSTRLLLLLVGLTALTLHVWTYYL